MDAALAIADRGGFRAVTMRAIAAEVGATPMALYAYFSNKNALYAGMRDRIFSMHVGAETISRQTWQSMLDGLARGLYQVMHERPNWTPVFAYHSGPVSSGLGFIDESVRLMREDGLSMEDAFAAYWGTMSFAVGSAMCERVMMGAGDGCARLLVRLRELPVHAPGRHATLAAAAQKLAGWNWDDAFERGIRSLLAGIEAKRARPEFPPKHRRRAPGTGA
jgi:AcrR family transcriptional regulator